MEKNYKVKPRVCFAKMVANYFRQVLLDGADTRPPVEDLISEMVDNYSEENSVSLCESGWRWMRNVALWPSKLGGYSPVGYSKIAGPKDPVNRAILACLSDWRNMEVFFAVSAWNSDKVSAHLGNEIADKHTNESRRLLLSKFRDIRKRVHFDEVFVADVYSAVIQLECKRKGYSLSGLFAGDPKGPNIRIFKGKTKFTDVPPNPGNPVVKGVTSVVVELKN